MDGGSARGGSELLRTVHVAAGREALAARLPCPSRSRGAAAAKSSVRGSRGRARSPPPSGEPHLGGRFRPLPSALRTKEADQALNTLVFSLLRLCVNEFLLSARPSRVGSADVTGSPAPPSKPDTVTWHALANTMRAGVAPGNRRRGRGSGIGSQVREGAEPAPSGSLPGSRREEKKRPYSSSDFPDGIFFVLIRAVGSEAWLHGARRRTLGAVLPRALVSRPCERAGVGSSSCCGALGGREVTGAPRALCSSLL